MWGTSIQLEVYESDNQANETLTPEPSVGGLLVGCRPVLIGLQRGLVTKHNSWIKIAYVVS